MTGVLIKRGGVDTDTHIGRRRGGHRKMQAKMVLQGKEHQRRGKIPEAGEEDGTGSPHTLRRRQPCPHPDFQLPELRDNTSLLVKSLSLLSCHRNLGK